MRFRAILRKNIVILQSNQNIRSMKADLIIGRDKEKAELQRCIDSDRSELVIVYGRSRVGKTYLVDEFFGRKYDFTFVGGHNLPPTHPIAQFCQSIKTSHGRDISSQIIRLV